jgi:hypothetical protein
MSETIRRDKLVTWVGTGATPTYTAVGFKNDELKIEMNPEIDEGKDVLGNNWSDVTGYAPSAENNYRAVSGTPLFAWLKDVFVQRKTLDDLSCKIVDVEMFGEPTTGAYPAWLYEGKITPKSYGGDTNALQYNFDLVYVSSVPVAGSFNPATKAFTPSGAGS